MFTDLHEGILGEFAERAAHTGGHLLEATVAAAAERERERLRVRRATDAVFRAQQQADRRVRWAATKADPEKHAARKAAKRASQNRPENRAAHRARCAAQRQARKAARVAA